MFNNENLLALYKHKIGEDKLISYIIGHLNEFNNNQLKIKDRLAELVQYKNEICLVLINKDFIERRFVEEVFLRELIVDYPDLRFEYTYDIDDRFLAKIIYKEKGIIKETGISR